MKNAIAIAASLLVNLTLIVAFEHSANEAAPVPNGEVTVTDLNAQALPSLARVPADAIEAG
jgi:hypothetical protein